MHENKPDLNDKKPSQNVIKSKTYLYSLSLSIYICICGHILE